MSLPPCRASAVWAILYHTKPLPTALSLIVFRLVKHFTNVSVFANMRLTFAEPLQNRPQRVSSSMKRGAKTIKRAPKTGGKLLTHLNIRPLQPLWRYRQGGFCPPGGSKTVKKRVRRDVSHRAQNRLTFAGRTARHPILRARSPRRLFDLLAVQTVTRGDQGRRLNGLAGSGDENAGEACLAPTAA